MEKTLLSLENVKLIYHSPSGETEALRDINLQVKEGELVAIVGPSGCGKTTVLSLIAGILQQTDGKILLEGRDIKDTKKMVGYMFQRDHLFEWRTIWQNVILGLEINKTNTPKNRETVLNLLKKYGLEDFKDNKPRQLSGGMRQRAALIRTLALNPKLLLLDEPFSALDYQTRLMVGEDVWNIIKEEKQTAILVTHDISEAISLSDRIIVLSKIPAVVKSVIDVEIKHLSPLKRRENSEFAKLFDKIWREMQTNEEENIAEKNG